MNIEEQKIRLLTIPQVQERLGLGRSSIYNLINAGELKAIKINKSVRIADTDVDKFIQSLLEG